MAKLVIRPEMFESNSSSTHSMVVLPRETYEKWKVADYLFIYDGEEKPDRSDWPRCNTLYTFEEVKSFLINAFEWKEAKLAFASNEYISHDLLEKIGWYNFHTFGSWNNDEWPLEEDHMNYTTEHGDEIVVRAKYGYEG